MKYHYCYMSENIEDQRDHIVEHLERLNKNVERQISVFHIFMTGIIYGVGFVIGSSILAAFAVGIVTEIFGPVSFISSMIESPIATPLQ